MLFFPWQRGCVTFLSLGTRLGCSDMVSSLNRVTKCSITWSGIGQGFQWHTPSTIHEGTPPGSFNRGELLSFMTIVHFLPDINECLTIVPSPCSCGVSGEPCGANCINLVPSFTCSCAPGFQLRSGGTICDGKNYYFLVRRKCFSMWNVLGVSINVFFYFDMI